MIYKFFVPDHVPQCAAALRAHVHEHACVHHMCEADFVVGRVLPHKHQIPVNHYQTNAHVLSMCMQMWPAVIWLELIKQKYSQVPGVRVTPHAFVEHTREFEVFCQEFHMMELDLVQSVHDDQTVLATGTWQQLREHAQVHTYHQSATRNRCLFDSDPKLSVQLHVPHEKLMRIFGLHTCVNSQVYCVSNAQTPWEKRMIMELVHKLYGKYTGFFDLQWYEELGYYHVHAFRTTCAPELISDTFLSNKLVQQILKGEAPHA